MNQRAQELQLEHKQAPESLQLRRGLRTQVLPVFHFLWKSLNRAMSHSCGQRTLRPLYQTRLTPATRATEASWVTAQRTR